LKYRENGKEKLASFGKYPIVTLNEARLKKDEFKIALGRGELPPKSASSSFSHREILSGCTPAQGCQALHAQVGAQ